MNDSTLTTEQYKQQLQQLQHNFDKIQLLVENIADHYARTDYDSLDATNRHINQLIEAGKVETADSLIRLLVNPANVLRQHQDIRDDIARRLSLAEEARQDALTAWQRILKQQIRDAEYLYKLYSIAITRNDFQQAQFYIETRAALDTTNVEWQSQAGGFFDDMTQHTQAMVYHQRALRLSLAQHGEQAQWTGTMHNNIGLTYSFQGDYTHALEHFQTAQTIYHDILGSQHPDAAVVSKWLEQTKKVMK